MEDVKAAEILKSLAAGVNPAGTEPLVAGTRVKGVLL